ncbi:MAG: hypothetical protein MUC63_01610 [Planctomycetes bacterium]|nr:hypothetical protein [Planctomycetota bacterium]
MKRANLVLSALLLALAGAAPGCSYLEARGKDFADCWRLTVGLGIGASASVEVGPIGWGVGYWEGYAVGVWGRQSPFAGAHQHLGIPFPLGLIAGPLAMAILPGGEGSDAFATMLFVATEIENVAPSGGEESEQWKRGQFLHANAFLDSERDGWADYFWIEAGARCLVGVHAGFNPAEFLDFLLGWVGIDLCGDDEKPPPELPDFGPKAARTGKPEGDGGR